MKGGGRRGDTGEMGEERESDRWSERGRRDQGNLHGKKKKKDVHVLHFIAAQLLVHLGLNMHAANTLCLSAQHFWIATIYYRHTCQRTSVRAVEQENQRSHDIRTTCDPHRLRA